MYADITAQATMGDIKPLFLEIQKQALAMPGGNYIVFSCLGIQGNIPRIGILFYKTVNCLCQVFNS
jgi:hypothetical protein